ncbi:MAG: cyclase [Cryomorphaceae bacterium]|jgi:cyclase
MPIITGHGNVPNLINTLYAMAKLNPTIVLTGHGSATTVKSGIRDADLLSSVWKKVTEGHEKDKKPNKILLDVSANLGQKYRPLYKDFYSEIERHVNLMYESQQ